MIKKSVIFFLLILSGCASFDLSDYEPGSFIIKGKVIYLPLEGGCWQMISAEGTAFELSGEDLSEILEDNTYAEIVVNRLEDVNTICMAGILVEVLDIINISRVKL